MNNEHTIPAEVRSDDRKQEVDFDAVLWFEQAADTEIEELAKCDWGGDYPADDVARWFATSDKRIDAMFAHDADEQVGFECHVAKTKALAWLQSRRPELAKRIGS